MICPFCKSPYPSTHSGGIRHVSSDCPSQCSGRALFTIECPTCGRMGYSKVYLGYLARTLWGDCDEKSFDELLFMLRSRGHEIEVKDDSIYDDFVYGGKILVVDEIPFITQDAEGLNNLAIYLQDWESVDFSILNDSHASMILSKRNPDWVIKEYLTLMLAREQSYSQYQRILSSVGDLKWIYEWLWENKEIFSKSLLPILEMVMMKEYPDFLLNHKDISPEWKEKNYLFLIGYPLAKEVHQFDRTPESLSRSVFRIVSSISIRLLNSLE